MPKIFVVAELVQSKRVRRKGFFFLGVAGWAVVGVIRFAAYLRTEFGAPRTLSAYDAMLIILTIAFALFHYWRFQDGRGAGAG